MLEVEEVTAGVLDGVRSIPILSAREILSMRKPAALLRLARTSVASLTFFSSSPCAVSASQEFLFLVLGLENQGFGLLLGVAGLLVEFGPGILCSCPLRAFLLPL